MCIRLKLVRPADMVEIVNWVSTALGLFDFLHFWALYGVSQVVMDLLHNQKSVSIQFNHLGLFIYIIPDFL